MSHYPVSVFTNRNTTVDCLLAPYDESLEVEKYVSLTAEQLIHNKRCRLSKFSKNQYQKYLQDPKGYLEEYCGGNPYGYSYKYVSSEFLNECSMTDEELLKRVLSYYDPDMQDMFGNVYSTYNPDAKWDWWVEGGRFADRLYDKTKKEYVNEARVSDIDFKKMRKDRTRFWTRAVVTPDGKWSELGQMGWFGLSSEQPGETIPWVLGFEERFLKPALQNDWTLTIVDCHI